MNKRRMKKTLNNKPIVLSSKLQIIFQSDIVKKYALIFIAFIAGASVMVIELAANRVLAPWFGNSIFTWTGLIGIILVAMSVGYYLGGWLADRKTDYLTLSHLLAAASVSIFLIPLLQSAISNSFMNADVMLGPVFASLLLFALPGCLLGSVSPYVIRLVSLLSADKHIGLSAGTIFMFSTLGSVIGTFGTGFILIPQMQLANIFLVIGVLIMFLSIIGYLYLSKNHNIFRSVVILCSLNILLIYFISKIGPESSKYIIFDKNTFYHRIKVIQEPLSNGDKLTSLFLDTTHEGAQYDISDDISIDYQKYWELSKVFCAKIDTAAFLGAGAFTMPQSLIKSYPKADVDVVEIDPQVIQVGRLFFKVDNYPELNVIDSDARRYLFLTKKQYDLIFGDVYNGVRYIPAHLVTKEFFNLVKNRLNKDGVFMMNLIGAVKGQRSYLFNSTLKTINSVFDKSYVFVINPLRLDLDQNIIIVALNNPKTFDHTKIMQSNNLRINKLLSTLVNQKEYDVSKAPLLTDNYNPIEYFIAKLLRERS